MPVSLNDILSNPELEKALSIDWVLAELKKAPDNQYLQELLIRKRQESGLMSRLAVQKLMNKILADDQMTRGAELFIRDIELDLDTSFAQAEEEKKDLKRDQITGAAISAGAIITGSIISGGTEAADQPDGTKEDPVSQTEQIEESGLLGFLNRLEGTITRSQPTPALDPMLKEENYQTKNEKEVPEETVESIAEESLSTDEAVKQGNQEELETKLEQAAEITTVEKTKKKKKVKEKANKGLRWSSMTKSDYKIKTLDPFTEWINKIDGVSIIEPEADKKSKKGKKKKKKGKHLESLQAKPEIASEQLADLLVNQGHIEQAISMYERLSLKYPEKSSFFAGKIDTIKDKL